MSLVLFVTSRAAMRLAGASATLDAAGPAPALVWLAIVIAAVVFAAGHLPALAQAVEPTPAIVVRTLVLNALAGCVYGWLYWRAGLESAMVAHAGTHVGLALARVLA